MTSEAVKRIEDVRFVRAVQVNEITTNFWVINLDASGSLASVAKDPGV